MVNRKYVDTTWDFRLSDTKRHTHCFHAYPAMMIPQVAGRLIDLYGTKAKLLFDPYCGSGTSLVEASLRGIDSVGTDLNPLARLISIAKTTFLPMKELDEVVDNFRECVFHLGFSNEDDLEVEVPTFRNIDYWFSEPIKKKLAYISQFISTISNPNIQNFFKGCFSETIREASWTRNGEFKLFRMTPKQIQTFNPDPYNIMEAKLTRACKGLKEFIHDVKGTPKAQVYDFNTVHEIPSDILKRESVDIVVTSPPYGDSRTTVAYGQYSRLSLEWLGFEDAGRIDSLLMGGKQPICTLEFQSPHLTTAIAEVVHKDEKRSRDVVSFYKDYEASIANVASLIKPKGFACYVVGNRKVKGVVLPTDEITVDLFSASGFIHIETIIRNIPNKRMPSRNSPTNVTGALDDTMTKEYIVVMQKT